MSEKNTNRIDDDIQKEILELVKARLGAIPNNVHISIGDEDYSKEDIMKSIDQGGEIGKDFIEIQMEYLRDLANGSLYATQ
jgi:hypothetical protein